VINRNTTYWWILNYAIFKELQLPDFGIDHPMALWNGNLDDLLKQTMKKTIDCVFHSEISASFMLLPITPTSHYGGVVFIDEEENTFDHPIYNEWATHSNMFPKCYCGGKERGVNVSMVSAPSDDTIQWFHDAMMSGIFTLPCTSFGSEYAASSSDPSGASTSSVPTTPIRVELHLLYDLPSFAGEVLGGRIKFPTIMMIEGYRYQFVIDSTYLLSPISLDKVNAATFDIWIESDDGRKITLFSQPMNKTDGIFSPSTRGKLCYGEIDSTIWSYIDVVSQETYVNSHNEFALFVDHKYQPQIVKDKARAMAIESKMRENADAIMTNVSSREMTNARLLVFFLDRYVEHGDMRITHKMNRNLIYKDPYVMSSAPSTMVFILKYAICHPTELDKLFTAPHVDKLVHDMSEKDVIELENIENTGFLYVIRPHIGLKKPFSASLPESLRFTVRGKTQAVRLLTITRHADANLEQAIRIGSIVNDITSIDVSTITSFNTYFNVATIRKA
jgi:hypothetical protein